VTPFSICRRAAGTAAVERWGPGEIRKDPRSRRYLLKFGIRRESPPLNQHTVRYHNPSDLELYSLRRPGEVSVHFLERHARSDLMRNRGEVFDEIYARLRGHQTCNPIIAHLAKDGNGHPPTGSVPVRRTKTTWAP
jgi:hypothetical protein